MFISYLDVANKSQSEPICEYVALDYLLNEIDKGMSDIASKHQRFNYEETSEFVSMLENALTSKWMDINISLPVYSSGASSRSILIERKETSRDVSLHAHVNVLYHVPKYDIYFGRLSVSGQGTTVPLLYALDEKSIIDAAISLKQIAIDEARKKYYIVRKSPYSGVYTEPHLKTSTVVMKDVFLDDQIKSEITQSIDQFFMDEGSFYKENGIAYQRGILLYGPPGNGKTTLINALINRVECNVMTWIVNEKTDSDMIEGVFSLCGGERPTLLIIEDMDSLAAACRSTFLNALDGIGSSEGIFIVATTNYPERVDPALLNRAGRFDRSYAIAKPTDKAKYSYLEKKGTLKFITQDKLKWISENTKEFSMTTMNEIYTSIALTSHYENGNVDVEKIVKSIDNVAKMQKKGDFEIERKSGLGFLGGD